MSVVMLMLSGIGVLAVWRGSLTTAKGWAVVAVAIGLGAALRYADAWLKKPLESFGGFFNKLFSPFSNKAFACSSVFPTSASVISEAEAFEMAQPVPWNPRSLMTSPST